MHSLRWANQNDASSISKQAPWPPSGKLMGLWSVVEATQTPEASLSSPLAIVWRFISYCLFGARRSIRDPVMVRSLLSFAPVYETFGRLIGGPRGRRRFAAEFVRAKKTDRVMDIGCGPGSMLSYLGGASYVGFDAN